MKRKESKPPEVEEAIETDESDLNSRFMEVLRQLDNDEDIEFADSFDLNNNEEFGQQLQDAIVNRYICGRASIVIHGLSFSQNIRMARAIIGSVPIIIS